MPFGDHFPLKIDAQINAKIDAEKVMKCHEKIGKCDWGGTEGLCCRKDWKGELLTTNVQSQDENHVIVTLD